MRVATRGFVLVAVLALFGCATGPGGGGSDSKTWLGHTRTVELHLVEGGTGSGPLEIDTTHHTGVVVFRGDRVAWSCACPTGTEFTIEAPHLLADFEVLEGGLVHGQGEAEEMLEELAAVGRAERPHPLFGDWTPGPPGEDRWFDGSETIFSPAVVPGPVAHGLWKFTWKVRRKGDPESEVVWDPHIYGHTGIKAY